MSTEDNSTSDGTDSTTPKRQVPIAWEALEDAFENNAHEVHSYLHLETGEVIRVVDGVADPTMHQRIAQDATYLRIDPVSSREQYRWMERFIATVEESELRQKLLNSIDGKGAFRRFKDVLMTYPSDRERWFTFRSERLRAGMEGWLDAHSVEVVERPEWKVVSSDDGPMSDADEVESNVRKNRLALVESNRRRLHQLVDLVPGRELDAALAFLEFLRERRHTPRLGARSVDVGRDLPSGEAELEGENDIAGERAHER